MGFPYHGDEGPLLPFYRELQAVASNAPGKVRILIYSGDVDPCINTFWSQNWTSHVRRCCDNERFSLAASPKCCCETL